MDLQELVTILGEPQTGAPLSLTESGWLQAPSGRRYPVRHGIPRFVGIEDAGQQQTATSFGYKWKRQETYQSTAMHDRSRDWLVTRYGFSSVQEMRDYFAGRRRILDAGCGSGFSALLWMNSAWNAGRPAEWVGLEISEAVDTCAERLRDIPGVSLVQGDVLAPPFQAGAFDAVFCEGVLHHTPSVRQGVQSLSALLSPQGELLFYVYRKKSPVREFSDDHVRAAISDMSPDQAWEALRPLTDLGRQLAELKAQVELTEDIPFLGIPRGVHDLQRLIYWHFMKLFWNPEFTFEENLHVNFDWYHPKYASRHTREELTRYCTEAGLEIRHLDEQESGYTIRALKR